MNKKNFILRYLLIIQKVKTGDYVSMKELIAYLQRKSEELSFHDETINLEVTNRTIQRDFKEIYSIFGIEIEYSKSHKGYFIRETAYDSTNMQKLLDEFIMFQSLKLTSGISKTIDVELQQPKGIENIYGIMHAIKNNLIVTFSFHEYYLEKVLEITGQPYAIKEHRNRWYLVMKEKNENYYTTYGLDRILSFHITDQKFRRIKDFDIKKVFEHNYGIKTGYGLKPQEIILSFERLQGQYVKHTPLHHSQKILKDTKDELLVSLFLIPTFDFRMELLSYGNKVKVIQPESFKNELIEIYKKTLEMYNMDLQL